eukprot:scaffold30564_cov58-Phaeocystis_antarctica.AAC.6
MVGGERLARQGLHLRRSRFTLLHVSLLLGRQVLRSIVQRVRDSTPQGHRVPRRRVQIMCTVQRAEAARGRRWSASVDRRCWWRQSTAGCT